MSALSKLNEARIKFHSLDIKKTGHNKFAGYYYFELGDFLIPALKVFHELKLSGVVSFGADLATMTITDLEDNTVHLITSPMSSAALKGCHDVQNLGAVQTYLRRYLWVAALEIVEHDAIDASSGADKPKSKATPNGGVWEALDDDARTFLTNIAMEVIDLLSKGDVPAAVAYLEAQNLDADEKVAIWTRFDSKQRAAIKKFQEETK